MKVVSRASSGADCTGHPARHAVLARRPSALRNTARIAGHTPSGDAQERLALGSLTGRQPPQAGVATHRHQRRALKEPQQAAPS